MIAKFLALALTPWTVPISFAVQASRPQRRLEADPVYQRAVALDRVHGMH